MKNLFLKFALVFATAFTLVSCDKEDDEIITADTLPVAATTFIAEYFPGVEVLSSKREKEVNGFEYDVVLKNGVEISFNEKGEWESVEATVDTQALPNTAFILSPIVEYVSENYTPAQINGIEKELSTFEVELTNGVDLVFNADGSFSRVDR